ncbi:MAG: CDP-glucose 4,6-dehydratase [Nitrospirae bacterium]|nr:CDP-glucose 4,6-dehydratase [Nitrospirota bacterium]
MNVRSFGNIYRNKRVLVTGHTGFKGSWLSAWLLALGAKVAGFSIDLPSKPSNFEVINLENKLKHIKGDVRDLKSLKRVFDDFSPEVVFHLAAQAITRLSYDIPHETFYTNMGGTVNVLECIRKSKSVKAAVIITSDKCYQNVEWAWGYRENDRLGGDDPYSASKACAETASHSYIKSFFSMKNSPKIATARAGNVIGGGDWASDRIVPDCIRAFSKKEKLEIRNPKAIRPWQHVLEPLSGYLCLGENLLLNNEKAAGESFNFGPLNTGNKSVEGLMRDFARIWGGGRWGISKGHINKKESTFLKLNCDKALHYLDWHAVLSFEEMVEMTTNWYKAFYGGKKDMYSFTANQIEEYTKLAKRQGLVWVKK